jgi:hypothetical protein
MAIGFAVPFLDCRLEAVTLGLDGKIDDAGGSAMQSRQGSGFEGIAGMSAHEGQFHVGVTVDAAREEVTTTGIDGPVRAFIQLLADGGNAFIPHQHICLEMISGRNNPPVTDQQ